MLLTAAVSCRNKGEHKRKALKKQIDRLQMFLLSECVTQMTCAAYIFQT